MTVRRRGVLLAGGLVGAVAAACGWAWRMHGEREVAASVWSLRFAAPDGSELVMSRWRGRPLVLNFWATWCAPCVREMPQFDRFHRDHGARGWQVVGLAIDGPKPVREFLARLPVGYPIGLAGLDGTELTRQLGNNSGGLPFTVVFDADGRIVQRKAGETSYDELTRWAARVR